MLEKLNARLREAHPDKIIVPGCGSASARVVLIGEAPGAQEEAQLMPFVGKAGQNLNEFLELSGINRGELYITNAVKFRPTSQGARGLVNRKPTNAEIKDFRGYLLEELEIIKPDCIVTLGAVPYTALTEKPPVMSEIHGRFTSFDAYTLYPMYHPASVIYNRGLKDVYREDVKRLGEWMRKNA